MIEALLNYSFNENPCLGCLSADCRACACAGEREKPDLRSLRVPQKKRSASAEGKAKVKHDPLMELLGEKPKYVRLPQELFGDLRDAFLISVDGNGMRNAGILTGDQVIFVRATQAESGDIIVGKINGSLMCRRVFIEAGGYRVRREDGETPDIMTTDCVIYGIMVGLARNYRKNR